jgi:hypothetical protein
MAAPRHEIPGCHSNFSALLASIRDKKGCNPKSSPHLCSPLINDLPICGPDNDSEVCSEFCCQLLQAGGLHGLDPFVTPPEKLAELKIYSRYEQAIGTPKRIKKSNTR